MPPLTASVIINNYNYGRFLAGAIDSALGQTWPHTEVIVVDDGSTDESLEVLAPYIGRVIPGIKDNGKQASAVNFGFELSRGDVIYFLDSDDRLEPDCVERTIGFFHDPEVAKVHWPMAVINEFEQLTGEIEFSSLPEGNFRDRVIRIGPANHQTPAMSGNAWSRSVIEKVMPIPEIMGNAVDSYLFALVPFHGRVRAVNTPLTRRGRHGSNLSGAWTAADRVELWERRAPFLLDYLKGFGIDASIEDWRRNNYYYRQLTGVANVRESIETHLPQDAELFLIGGSLFNPAETAPGRAVQCADIDAFRTGDDAFVLRQLDTAIASGVRFAGIAGQLYRREERLTLVEARLRNDCKMVHESRWILLFELASEERRAGRGDSIDA